MIRPTTLSYPSAVAVLCGLLCGLRFASAVVAKPKNVSSLPEVTAGHSIRGDRVDTIAPPDSRASPSTDRLASKDYDGGDNYALKNTYGPPRSYYNGYHDYDDVYHHHPQDHHHHPQDHYDHHHHHNEHLYQHSEHHDDHKSGHELNVQPLLWPLAGITLLGVLSALVQTPLLLHLGPVVGRRRRRRDVQDEGSITKDMIKSLLDKLKTKGLPDNVNSEPCLVCDVVASIYDRKSTCLERSVCEVMSRHESIGAEMDQRLLTAMIAQVDRNNEIPDEFKRRLRTAETDGRRSAGDCGRLYPCAGDGIETVRK